jgi:L-ascorbate metabolism protein UlaG (beta-lactamase superfamily)
MATLTWLGQSGFLIESGGERLLIDPFFSEHEGRMYPPPPIDEFGANIDRVLVTHEHLDHFDPPSLPRIAERSPGVEVIVPAPIAREGLTGVRPGDRFDGITVVPALHAVHPSDGYADHGGRFVGYVIERDGVAIYHAGDSVAGDELVAALDPLRIDVALLPVNGRSYFREQQDLAGNMDVRDAVALATRIGAHTLVPMHWDLMKGNLERAGAAADEAYATSAPVHVVTPARGVPWTP